MIPEKKQLQRDLFSPSEAGEVPGPNYLMILSCILQASLLTFPKHPGELLHS